MFDNNRSIDGDERIAWRIFRRAFCNGNNAKEDFGCWILVANYVQGCAWLLQILWCISKNMRISNSKSCKVGHKFSRGTIYEMGTWFCGANEASREINMEQYILVATDYAKWVEARALRTNTTSIIAKILYECILTRFGCPLTIIIDQGVHFINDAIKYLTNHFLMKHVSFTTHYP
jgi:hypothetical protein